MKKVSEHDAWKVCLDDAKEAVLKSSKRMLDDFEQKGFFDFTFLYNISDLAMAQSSYEFILNNPPSKEFPAPDIQPMKKKKMKSVSYPTL